MSHSEMPISLHQPCKESKITNYIFILNWTWPLLREVTPPVLHDSLLQPDYEGPVHQGLLLKPVFHHHTFLNIFVVKLFIFFRTITAFCLHAIIQLLPIPIFVSFRPLFQKFCSLYLLIFIADNSNPQSWKLIFHVLLLLSP